MLVVSLFIYTRHEKRSVVKPTRATSNTVEMKMGITKNDTERE